MKVSLGLFLIIQFLLAVVLSLFWFLGPFKVDEGQIIENKDISIFSISNSGLTFSTPISEGLLWSLSSSAEHLDNIAKEDALVIASELLDRVAEFGLFPSSSQCSARVSKKFLHKYEGSPLIWLISFESKEDPKQTVQLAVTEKGVVVPFHIIFSGDRSTAKEAPSSPSL